MSMRVNAKTREIEEPEVCSVAETESSVDLEIAREPPRASVGRSIGRASPGGTDSARTRWLSATGLGCAEGSPAGDPSSAAHLSGPSRVPVVLDGNGARRRGAGGSRHGRTLPTDRAQAGGPPARGAQRRCARRPTGGWHEPGAGRSSL